MYDVMTQFAEYQCVIPIPQFPSVSTSRLGCVPRAASMTRCEANARSMGQPALLASHRFFLAAEREGGRVGWGRDPLCNSDGRCIPLKENVPILRSLGVHGFTHRPAFPVLTARRPLRMRHLRSKMAVFRRFAHRRSTMPASERSGRNTPPQTDIIPFSGLRCRQCRSLVCFLRCRLPWFPW